MPQVVRTTPPRAALSVVAALLVGVCLSACGGDVSLPAPIESAERESAERESEPAAPAGDFCGVLAELAEGQAATDDPAQVIEQLAEAGDVAPPELRGDFETLSAVAEDLRDLEPDDLEGILDVVLDPDARAAAGRVLDYAAEECGVDLDAATDGTAPDDPPSSSGTATDDPPSSSTGDIDLEHIDAIKDANPSAAWADALSLDPPMR